MCIKIYRPENGILYSDGNICVINWCKLWYLLRQLKFYFADFGCERQTKLGAHVGRDVSCIRNEFAFAIESVLWRMEGYSPHPPCYARLLALAFRANNLLTWFRCLAPAADTEFICARIFSRNSIQGTMLIVCSFSATCTDIPGFPHLFVISRYEMMNSTILFDPLVSRTIAISPN